MHYYICDYISEAAQNSLEAGATRVEVTLYDDGDRIGCRVRDNGPGMGPAALKRALDPFYSGSGAHPGRSVGLGFPFIRRAALTCSGTFSLQSRVEMGTDVRFSFSRRHIDTPPLGDWPAAATQLLSSAGDAELIINRIKTDRHYRVRCSRLREALGDLDRVGNRSLVRRFIVELDGDDGVRKTG